MPHVLVNIAATWIMIGMALWIVLDRCGVIAMGIARRKPNLAQAVSGSVITIMLWPAFVYVIWLNRKEAWAKLKKVVW